MPYIKNNKVILEIEKDEYNKLIEIVFDCIEEYDEHIHFNHEPFNKLNRVLTILGVDHDLDK